MFASNRVLVYHSARLLSRGLTSNLTCGKPGTMLPKILVLEDSPERIEWLRRATAGRARVVWVRGVTSFRRLYLRLQSELRLVILDHDLGLSLARALEFNPRTGLYTSYSDPCRGGPKGLDGSDAASWLAVFGYEVPCPVWVWSWNVNPAKSMAQTLSDGGVKIVAQQPFEPRRGGSVILDCALGDFTDD